MTTSPPSRSIGTTPDTVPAGANRGPSLALAITIGAFMALVIGGCGGGASSGNSGGIQAVLPAAPGDSTDAGGVVQASTTGAPPAPAATPPAPGATSPAAPAPATSAASASSASTVPAEAGSRASGPLQFTPATPPPAARLDSVLLGHAILYPSHDPELVLVQDKEALVIVRLTTGDVTAPKPTGTVRVKDASDRTLAESQLALPTGPLPATTPERLGFDNVYSATIPGHAVRPGMRIDVELADGQLAGAFEPKVGSANAIKLVMVPVRVGGNNGEVGIVQPAGAAQLLERAPLSAVDAKSHPIYDSSLPVPVDIASARAGSATIMNEIGQLRLLEQADPQTFYFGFLATRQFPGVGGIAQLGGRSSVSVGDPLHLPHEVAHNIGLRHAPCGDPAMVDPHYPYANALLGAAGRYIWGYIASVRQFVDPRDPRNHDRMSYCSRDTFSDYNYRLMQRLLSPDQEGGGAAEPPSDAERAVLLIAGTLRGAQVQLAPVKLFQGRPSRPEGTTHRLRLTTASGVVEYPFAATEVDHDESVRTFAFSVPSPGPVLRLQILRGSEVIHEVGNEVRKPGGAAALKPAADPVQFEERNAEMRVSWDSATYPFLSIVHVGSQRTVLAQDLVHGSASRSVAGLASGGSFEFILSDGLDSLNLVRPR